MGMSTPEFSSIVWTEVTVLQSARLLAADNGLDLYLEDDNGDELNVEMSNEVAIELRDKLLDLYPVDEEEEETTSAEI